MTDKNPLLEAAQLVTAPTAPGDLPQWITELPDFMRADMERAYLAGRRDAAPNPPSTAAGERETVVDGAISAIYRTLKDWNRRGFGADDVTWCEVRAEVVKIVAALATPPAQPTLDLVAHLYRQRAFSVRAFGPGTRAAGVLDHIRKELKEIEAKPDDLSEWIDVVLLACDGAWRQGYSPEQIAQALAAKLARNEARTWPDWRTADPNKAIEHVRGTSNGAIGNE